MPTLETLTEADLKKNFQSSSLRKARSYTGRVREPMRSGSTLRAKVSGTFLYEVEIEVGPGGIHAHCSCPYNWGGLCKHVGAVLLRWIGAPGTFVVQEAAAKLPGYPLPVTPVEPPPTTRPKHLPFWMTGSAAERQQAAQQQLAQWLESLKMQELRELAAKRGWDIKGTKKADLVEQIVPLMINPDEALKAAASLSSEHQQVFRAVVVLGNEPGIQMEDLERVASSWGSLTRYKQLSTYTDHLSQSGLVISGQAGYSYPPRIDFVPYALASQLPPVLAGLIPAGPEISSDQPASDLQIADPLALVRTAHKILLLLEQSTTVLRPPMPRPQIERFYPGLAEWDYDPPEVLAAKERGKLQGSSELTLKVPPPAPSLPDEAVERLAPVAGGEARLEFIFSLLVATGLLQPGSPVTPWPEVKEQFLRHNELRQRAILSRVYFQMRNWSELWAVLRAEEGLQLRRSWLFGSTMKPEGLRNNLARLRLLVLRVLASLPDNQWLKLDDLLPLLRTVWPRFDQVVEPSYYYDPSGQRRGWFLARADSQRPLAPKNEADWQLAQGNFIRQLISGPLAWLGLVDLLYKDGALLELRLHGLSDLYWDRVEVPDTPHHPVIQAVAASSTPAEAIAIDQETITVNPAAVSAQAHNLFDQIARLDEVTPDRFTYTLSGQAVHDAFEAGRTLADLLADWDQLLVIPMPETIRSRLQAWWQAYGQVRIYEDVTVIEFGDDYALAEMKAVTSLEKYLIAEISPQLVLIPAEAVEPLTAELEKAGYTPKQTDQV